MTDEQLRRIVALVPTYGDDTEHAYQIRIARAVLAAQAAVKPAQKATDAQIREWADRHDLGISSITDLRCIFEDAASLHLAAPVAAASPPPGYVLVPVEPTPEIIGAMAVEEATGSYNGTKTLGMAGAALAYDAAIRAAMKGQQHG